MLTDNDFLLLSAYLDDELSPIERTVFEGRLRSEPALQSELADLQQVMTLAQEMPRLKAPRNYTLTPAMVGQKPRILYPWRALAAVAAAVVIVILGGVLLNFGSESAKQTSQSDREAAVTANVMGDTEIASLPTLSPTAEVDTTTESSAAPAESSLQAESVPADETVLPSPSSLPAMPTTVVIPGGMPMGSSDLGAGMEAYDAAVVPQTGAAPVVPPAAGGMGGGAGGGGNGNEGAIPPVMNYGVVTPGPPPDAAFSAAAASPVEEAEGLTESTSRKLFMDEAVHLLFKNLARVFALWW